MPGAFRLGAGGVFVDETAAVIRDIERRTSLVEQRVAAHEEWQQAIERWQQQQNGHLAETSRSLKEINQQIDRLRDILIGALVTLVINLILQLAQMAGG